MQSNYDKVIKQIGGLNMSKHHLTGWSEAREPSIKKLLSYNISATKFPSRRTGVTSTGYYSFFVIDWDGTEEDYHETTTKLKQHNISYIAFGSPSHWIKLKVGEYRMRLLVPVSGVMSLSKEGHEAQYLAFITDMSLPTPDKTGGETKRFFYPTVMKGITQPPHGDKPTNQKMKKARNLVDVYLGSKYKLKNVQEAMKMVERVMPHLYEKNASTGKYKRSKRTVVDLPRSHKLYHKGKKLGKFKKLARKNRHVRIDCPFDDAHLHSDGEGRDYAFIEGDRIICESSTHGNIVGRMEDELLSRMGGMKVQYED